MAITRTPILTLRFPMWVTVMGAVFTLVGIAALVVWGPEFFSGADVGYPRKLKFLLLLLIVIGPGMVAMTAQVVRVYEDSIESRLFGIGKTVSRSGCTTRNTSNGFVIEDSAGRTIHVHRLMPGSGELYELCQRRAE